MKNRALLALSLFAVLSLPSPARADAYTAPTIGALSHYDTKYEDTMVNMARTNDLGYIELLAANPGVDPWLPGKGVDLTLPKLRIIPDAPHSGVVINLPEMRLFYYPHPNAKPVSFPIGIGREGLQTPIGQTTVRAKVAGPIWKPTPRMRAEDPTLPIEVGPGPDNPMGDFVLYLGWPQYGIHGTNKPYGIGRRSSSGCIRMYPEDIAALWPQVPVGTVVTVVNEPVLAAWIGNKLYVEAHPTMGQADRMEQGSLTDRPTYELSDQDMQYILHAAGVYADKIDWRKVRKIVQERRGYPIAVAERPSAASPKNASDDSDAPAATPVSDDTDAPADKADNDKPAADD